jgi:hypothetical protein
MDQPYAPFILIMLTAVVFGSLWLFVAGMPRTRAGKTGISYFALFTLLASFGVIIKLLNPALPWGPPMALTLVVSTLSTIAFGLFITS